MITKEKLLGLRPEMFRSAFELTVRYRDLDTFAHVNNAVYLTYIETGRSHYIRNLLGDEINWKDRGFILGTNHVVYVHPLFLFDKVVVRSGVARIGERSVTFVSLVENGQGKPSAYGYAVLVAYDFENKRSIPVPEVWRERFEKTDRFLLDYFGQNS